MNNKEADFLLAVANEIVKWHCELSGSGRVFVDINLLGDHVGAATGGDALRRDALIAMGKLCESMGEWHAKLMDAWARPS